MTLWAWILHEKIRASDKFRRLLYRCQSTHRYGTILRQKYKVKTRKINPSHVAEIKES